MVTTLIEIYFFKKKQSKPTNLGLKAKKPSNQTRKNNIREYERVGQHEEAIIARFDFSIIPQ